VIVVAIVSDLILASRIEGAAARSGADYRRVDSPDALPAPGMVDLLLVDWSARQGEWGDQLLAWRAARNRPRVILFGPHTDMAAHDAARHAGLGPMWARSKLVSELPHLLDASRVAEGARPAR
jgi:hypothetical protein